MVDAWRVPMMDDGDRAILDIMFADGFDGYDGSDGCNGS